MSEHELTQDSSPLTAETYFSLFSLRQLLAEKIDAHHTEEHGEERFLRVPTDPNQPLKEWFRIVDVTIELPDDWPSGDFFKRGDFTPHYSCSLPANPSLDEKREEGQIDAVPFFELWMNNPDFQRCVRVPLVPEGPVGVNTEADKTTGFREPTEQEAQAIISDLNKLMEHLVNNGKDHVDN
jgi:hypothetical protein